jgi:hypothetical protein
MLPRINRQYKVFYVFPVNNYFTLFNSQKTDYKNINKNKNKFYILILYLDNFDFDVIYH